MSINESPGVECGCLDNRCHSDDPLHYNHFTVDAPHAASMPALVAAACAAYGDPDELAETALDQVFADLSVFSSFLRAEQDAEMPLNMDTVVHALDGIAERARAAAELSRRLLAASRLTEKNKSNGAERYENPSRDTVSP